MEYNPHVPQIIGQEWVAIRNESLILNPTANTLERGYTFSLGAATRINNVRFYLKEWNPTFGSNMVFTASVYPAGQEASSGPIRSVVIPTGAVIVTGSGSRIFPTPTGTDPASALYGSGDNLFLYWIMGQGATAPIGMSIFFATNAFAQLLNGKRLLGVDLLIGINVVSQGFEIEDIFQSIQVHVSNDFNYDPVQRSDTWRLPDLITNRTPESTQQIVRMHLGDANRFFGVGALTTAGVHNINQWTYPQLQRFEASASNRLQIILTEGSGIAATLGPEVQIEYAALEVFYCEETRVLAGSRVFNDDIPNRPLRDPFTLGMNAITVRNPTTLDENFNLPAGTYTVTISESNTGDNYYSALYRSVATLNEVRQLYEIPSLQGTQVNIPFPLNDDIINTTLTSESTTLIPQLTMHTSGGTLVDYSHVYGQQSAGQVYGTNTVSQQILTTNAAGTYSQVRWYARRFGATTAPLVLSSTSATISGSTALVQITPAEWDALPEILDGWKEITRTFPTALALGGISNPTFRWSATAETAGNRWEVLGATAPAVSGFSYQPFATPWFNQVPSGQQLYSGTYGYPSLGASINETWMPQWGPYVSGAAADQASDATILFSQDMPTVTGFTVAVTSQALTGIGLNCGISPCGIPTHILYPRLTWGGYGNSASVTDTFTRAATGWGTTDSGQVYTDLGGTVEGNYVTTGSYGTHVMDGAANTIRASVLTSTFATNVHQRVKVTVNQVPTGASMRAAAIFNYQDVNNYDFADLRFTTGNTVELVISRLVAGVSTSITNVQVGLYGPNQWWYLDMDYTTNGTIRMKAWPVGQTEPTFYQASTTATFTSGAVGLRSIRSTGNTNTGAIMSFDDWEVSASTYNFGYLELQRRDDITDWATIMKATNPGTVQFNDFEARTDSTSQYRIRGVDVYEFAGPWSSTASVFLTSPGVSGSCFGHGEHVMIFTSNERQDGSINLAYSNVWESEVTEDFANAESGFTQLQPMFERDFYTAFRPLERGGDQFSRSLLVNAAAISPPTLTGFTSLYDMAWEDVSYICVRDEDGNRWFATVNVPGGAVKNRRKLYLATINIIEVTETPSPVDP